MKYKYYFKKPKSEIAKDILTWLVGAGVIYIVASSPYFDIAQLKTFYRDAFRGKLKELGFYRLQDSVWICPFDCQDEIELLRDFFGLTHKEMRLILAEDIGPDNLLRKIFKI